MTREQGEARSGAGRQAGGAPTDGTARDDELARMHGGVRRTSAWASPAAALRRQFRYFVAALGYFTRVPVPHAIAFDARDLAGASRYFPLVGALVGAAGAVVYLLSRSVFPATVAVLLSMAATLLLTGALHEDGLADCCDGLGGGASKDDALRIMRDPRLGAFGAIGLVMALALKWQTLASLPAATAAWTMIGAHAASRALAVSYLATHDYAREDGKAKRVAQRMSMRSLAAALALGLPWLFLGSWRAAALALAVAAVLRWLLGRYFARKLGGYTGDCLGFSQQIFELAIYLSVLAWTSF
jgi:adenosylcobinamide-GDP ribazoletransferase